MAVELEESQEAPQGARRHLGRAGATAGGVRRAEAHQVFGAEGLPAQGAVTEPAAEESSGVPESIGARRFGQAAVRP